MNIMKKKLTLRIGNKVFLPYTHCAQADQLSKLGAKFEIISNEFSLRVSQITSEKKEKLEGMGYYFPSYFSRI